MFRASRWHVRSVEQTILRAGEKMPKHTMPWIYRTRTSITKSSSSRSLDHLEGPRSKEFGGLLQSSLLLRLSRSISMLLTDCSTQEAQPHDAANPLAVAMTSSRHVYEVGPRKDHRGVDLIFRCAAIRSPLVRGAKRSQQSSRLCAIYFAFLVWDSVRARHTSIAETAVRPSQGRRSRNVMTMVALS